MAASSANNEVYKTEDAGSLVHQLDGAWKSLTASMKKPNVLLTGMTGAGKSSVINNIFQMNIAQTGTGTPITQKFEMFSHPDRPVVLFDAKGLEHGHHEEFIAAMRKFFEDQSRASPTDAIHVIWYVVNAANARFQPFEEILLRDVFREIPIIVILNKSDISKPQDNQALREMITKLQLKNLLGVFDCTAQSKSDVIGENVEVCPKCKSENISIKPKQKLMICDNCGHRASFGVSTESDGLERVVEATLQALPEFCREAFISAQFVNFSVKEQKSQAIIREHYNSALNTRLSGSLTDAAVAMLSRLSNIWDFPERQGGAYVSKAQQFATSMSFKDKVTLLLKKKKTFALETTSVGILWARCLQRQATLVLQDFVKAGKSSAELDKEWNSIVAMAFQDLTPDNQEKIVGTLEQKNLDAAFEYEKSLLVDSYNQMHDPSTKQQQQ